MKISFYMNGMNYPMTFMQILSKWGRLRVGARTHPSHYYPGSFPILWLWDPWVKLNKPRGQRHD